MSKNEKTDIWDVMFSLDKKHFPISRNYLQEPRGSSNYINSQVKMEPNKDYLEFCEKLNPVELYALDLELNFLFRKLADFILLARKEDVIEEFEDTGFSLVYSDLIDYDEKLEVVLVDNFDLFPCDNLTYPAYEVAYSHIMKGKKPLGNIPNSMRTMAELQFTIEYYIENSDWNWRTKAEAFLRSHYFNNFQYADDETLIYLQNTCAYGTVSEDGNIHTSGACNFSILNHLDFDFFLFDINNKIHETVSNVALARWEHYEKAWQSLSYSQENPFAEKGNISGLRYFNIHNLHFLNELLYNSESRHLFSSQDIGSFCKMLNIFRSGLESKYIQKVISNMFEVIVNTIGKQYFILGYNYTYRDRLFLLSLSYQFLGGRFSKIEYDQKFLWSRDNLFFKPWNLDISDNIGSTLDFDKEEKSFLPLICFNMFAVWFGKPDKYKDYLSEAFKYMHEKQNCYGFWYDSNFNPEFMTILALDAYNVESSSDQSFPNTKIELVKDLITEPEQSDKGNLNTESQNIDFLTAVNARYPIHIETLNITMHDDASKTKIKAENIEDISEDQEKLINDDINIRLIKLFQGANAKDIKPPRLETIAKMLFREKFTNKVLSKQALSKKVRKLEANGLIERNSKSSKKIQYLNPHILEQKYSGDESE